MTQMDNSRTGALRMAPFLLAVILMIPVAAKAQSVVEFYKGKTITLHVGFGPGGGYDAYARTLAQFYTAHVPGKPAIVVKNTPGAGSLVLASSLYSSFPRDGTVIGAINRTLPLNILLGVVKSTFDPRKMSWIGSPATEVSACVGWHKARAKSVADLQQTQMLMGGVGKASDASTYPKLFKAILGLNFKVVEGYRGSADVTLALERGEVEGFCPWGWASMRATRPQWLREGKLNILMQLGMRKSPDHPNIPFVLDMAKTPEDRQALELMMSPLLYSRPLLGPPGIPTERLNALRQALKATVADPGFVAAANKRGLEIGYVSGEETQTTLDRIYATPTAVIDRVKSAMQ